jgi:hypothetical protein
MKLAKASQKEIDTLMRWLQAREKTDDPPPPYMRIVFGYETLLQNCADPAADVLEFKPELKAAMEDAKNMEWLARRDSLVVHVMDYRVEWNGDLRKRLTAYRTELGDLPVREDG